ncbi:MAG: hypothetical protein GEU90_19960 [Gemmatimonas sp.]|nr:hypothetical protein [Gemmatimonas sp.]
MSSTWMGPSEAICQDKRWSSEGSSGRLVSGVTASWAPSNSTRELFGAHDDEQLRGFLALVSSDRVKGHWICPCGSGRKLRHCHREQVDQVRDRLPSALLQPMRQALKSIRKRRS